MNEDKPVRSGRQARQAERAQKGHGIGRPYIVRNIPTYDVLSEENLLRIEAPPTVSWPRPASSFATTRWRSTTGSRAGAKVDGLLVKFEPGMLREILKSAPAEFHPARPQPGEFGADRRARTWSSPPPTAAPS